MTQNDRLHQLSEQMIMAMHEHEQRIADEVLATRTTENMLTRGPDGEDDQLRVWVTKI